MKKNRIREWKKVFESDLTYIAYELKDIVTTPAMILLEGPLGAGKTTFSKVFIEDGQTLSPTYSILSETNHVLHADMYRIKDRDEIIYLELPLYLENKIYFLVEWGEKHFYALSKELPEDFNKYLLEIVINKNSGQNQESSRDFILFKIEEE